MNLQYTIFAIISLPLAVEFNKHFTGVSFNINPATPVKVGAKRFAVWCHSHYSERVAL